MKQNIIRKTCQVVPVLLITGALAACDAHIEESEETKYPVHVLCVDGTVIPYSEYEQSKEQAIAVVFHIGSDGETEGNGYAVYLWDMTPKAFADSLGVEQGTSADITAYDGNENTFALYETEETASPMAEAVLPCGNTGRAPMFPRWLRCACCMRHVALSIRSSRNAAETRFRPKPTSAGTGHRRRWKDSRRSKHGSTRQPAEPCRKRPRRRRIKCVPL